MSTVEDSNPYFIKYLILHVFLNNYALYIPQLSNSLDKYQLMGETIVELFYRSAAMK